MWRRRIGYIVALAFVGLSLTPSFGQAPNSQPDFYTLRDFAEDQARDPAVARYLAQVNPALDTMLTETLVRCVRRELYSRRAESAFVLTVEEDGQISSVVLKVENRMGACSARTLEGLRLPPPPLAPMQIYVGPHFGER